MTVLLVTSALVYIFLLFTIAHFGDRTGTAANKLSRNATVYSMALAIYCTSWTYYGAVGNAAEYGWAFFPILLGPILLFVFGIKVLEKLVSVSKQQNITSIADFIASRYGKRQRLALFVTLIAALATIPYIALQLKAVGMTFTVLSTEGSALSAFSINELVAAGLMAVFAMLFGTRHVEVTEYRSGMILAIAFESAVKLVALLVAAWFAYGLFSQSSALSMVEYIKTLPAEEWSWQAWSKFDFIVQTFMAAGVILCLPRQFHVAVVDNVDVNHLKTARWGFPLYLSLTALAIIPIAITGNVLLGGSVDSTTYALQLPMLENQTALALLIFIGGFSAATAMVVIASVTLSTMLTNDVIMPFILQRRRRLALPQQFIANNQPPASENFQQQLLIIRRIAIALTLLLSYLCYYFWAANTGLVSIGLLAFSVVLQLLPAIIGGLYWRRGHARGVYIGLGAGLVAWLFAVAVPMYLPHELSDTSIITRGTVISIAINTLTYIAFSLFAQPRLIDRIQATAFVQPRTSLKEYSIGKHHQATNADMVLLLRTFLGPQRAQQLLEYFNRAEPEFLIHDANQDDVASRSLINYVERALSGVLGAATARSLIEAALRDRRLHLEEIVHFFDDTTQALQTQQSILFSSLENLAQGISVIDSELRLVAWNKRYLDLFEYPEGMVKPGQPIATLIRYNAERGECGPGEIDELVSKRLHYMQVGSPHRFIRRRGDGRVIEMVGNPLPDGGFVTSFTDITEHVETAQALEEANIDLEQRISTRQRKIREINNELTEEIERRRAIEVELKQAKLEAEHANASKTRFLALASHDILQPLNAARLYLSAVDEKQLTEHNLQLMGKLDTALASTEHLLSTLLQIAKMDQGALQPTFKHVQLQSILAPLIEEYGMLAQQRQIQFSARYKDAVVYTDPTYLRRIVQNFLSNAIKYNKDQGRVLLAVRPRKDAILIQVWDTGPGITAQQRGRIFDAFYRGNNTRVEGVGLGLSVAKRMSEQLRCELTLRSVDGHGSCFSVKVPLGNAAQVISKAVHDTDEHGPADNLHLLCVDDDPENLSAMRALLEKWGCTVATFKTSADAIAYARSTERPDGLLLDYQLSDDPLDGLTLARELRTIWGDNVAAALITAMRDDSVRQQARQQGLHFMPKPVRPAALKALLKYIQQRR